MYQEDDNLNEKAIAEYMKLSEEELDRLIAERLKEIANKFK